MDTLISYVFDDGECVTKIIINAFQGIKGSEVKLDTFSVTTMNSFEDLEIEQKQMKIMSFYVSNEFDGPACDRGKYIILEIDTNDSSTLYWHEENFKNYRLKLRYKVVQDKPIGTFYLESRVKIIDTVVNYEVDLFTKNHQATPLKYRDYKPKNDGKLHPLIIWLHGAGEGGENNQSQILANRGAVAFVTKEAQAILDYPFVLAPQCPSFWVDELKVGDRVLKGSNYVEKTLRLIQNYIDENEFIDPKRVYIGGASMGGYQTWNVLLREPNLFAAAFPICSAIRVHEEELLKVIDKPIWLTHSNMDDIISVQNSRDIFNYLKEYNPNVHYTEYQEIMSEGKIMGSHASWIPFLRNEPQTENGLSVFEWLALQSLDL